jgi:HK97 family phage prohead protease
MQREVRFSLPAEIRAEGNGIRVSGYAAIFDERADIAGYFTESFAPGAFAAAVTRDDVVFLINHDSLPLGRTRAGTLTLREDARGLYMEADLDPEDPDVRSIVGKMKRGDLDKMSIAFSAIRQEWDESVEPPHRRVLEARLYDVSIVNVPAYEGTEIGLRSLDAARDERRRQNHSAAARRIRMKKNLSQRVMRGA